MRKELGEVYFVEIEKDEYFDLYSYKTVKFPGVVICEDGGFESEEKAYAAAYAAFMETRNEIFVCLCENAFGERCWLITSDIDTVDTSGIYTSLMGRDKEQAQEVFEQNFFPLEEWESGMIETPETNNIVWFCI